MSRRERVGPTITLTRVEKADPHELRLARGDLPRDPVRTRTTTRPVVRVQERRAGIHVRKPRSRPRVDGQTGDRCVPYVIGRKRRAIGPRQDLATISGPHACGRSAPRADNEQQEREYREERNRTTLNKSYASASANHSAWDNGCSHVVAR